MQPRGVLSLVCLVAACLIACLSLTLVADAAAVPCGPAGSGLPQCNGTVTVNWDALNCQGNATYMCDSDADAPQAPQTPPDSCPYSGNGYWLAYTGATCQMGTAPTTNYYYRLSTDSPSTANCSQSVAQSLSELPYGTCQNTYSSYTEGTSQAIICDISELSSVSRSGQGIVHPAPVVIGYFGDSACIAPGRCTAIVYTTNFDDAVCGHSTEATNTVPDDLEFNVLYELRNSVSGPTSGNIEYTVDSSHFYITIYPNGPSGPAQRISTLVDTCFVTSTSSSTMLSLDRSRVPSSPTSAITNPTSAAVTTTAMTQHAFLVFGLAMVILALFL